LHEGKYYEPIPEVLDYNTPEYNADC